MDNNDNHYYHHDKEWEFLEIQGSKNHYYFKCSKTICKGFGMIEYHDNENKFEITKLHAVDYYNHSYYINKISPKALLNGKIKKEILAKEYIRCTLFKR